MTRKNESHVRWRSECDGCGLVVVQETRDRPEGWIYIEIGHGGNNPHVYDCCGAVGCLFTVLSRDFGGIP